MNDETINKGRKIHLANKMNKICKDLENISEEVENSQMIILDQLSTEENEGS